MRSLLPLLTLLHLATARTDLAGCVSSVVPGEYRAMLLWYVPETGEICDIPDCGRWVHKTTMPECPMYSGTASYHPSYLPGYGPGGKPGPVETAPAPNTVLSVTTTSAGASRSSETGETGGVVSTVVTESKSVVSATGGTTTITGMLTTRSAELPGTTVVNAAPVGGSNGTAVTTGSLLSSSVSAGGAAEGLVSGSGVVGGILGAIVGMVALL